MHAMLLTCSGCFYSDLNPKLLLRCVLLQVCSRAISAESGASDALAESAALEQQLHATKAEVGAGSHLEHLATA